VRSFQAAAAAKPKLLLLVLMLLAFIATLYVQYPAFENPYRVDDDFRQYYWMERFVDPDLFPDDYLLSHVKRVRDLHILGMDLFVRYESWGFSLLYQIASYLMPPAAFNKVLPFGLMFVSVFFLFELGRVLKGETAGFLLALLFIVFNLSASPNISVLPGLERSFSFPLLIAFLYYFVQGSPIACALILALQAVFYFPIFVVSVATYALSVVHCKGRRLSLSLTRRRFLALVLGTALGLILFSPALLGAILAEPANSASMPVWKNPYYSQNGRIPIFYDHSTPGPRLFWVMGYGGLATDLGISNMLPLTLLLMLMLTTLGIKTLRFPRQIMLLLLGSLSAWGLCWISALLFREFVLRYPFKYTSAALPLFLLVSVAYNAESTADAVAWLWIRRTGRSGLLLASFGALLIMITALTFPPAQDPFFTPIYPPMRIIGIGLGGLLYILGVNQLARLRLEPSTYPVDTLSVPERSRWIALGAISVPLILSYGLRMHSLPTMVRTEKRDLYQFVATLPKGVLLAGDPWRASNIPLFSKRSVLFSAEIIGVDDRTILDFYDAYYSDSSKSIVSFCREYNVQYLVINQGQFSPDFLAQGYYFYAPYNATIAQTVGTRSRFILPQIPDDRKAFQSNSLFVVECDEATFANLD
jgi:hypothetical protein